MTKRYREVPNYDEIIPYIDSCFNYEWKLIAKGLYYTGARIGELMQIKVKHVWEEEHFIKVKLMTEKNKKDTERIIPISKNVEPDACDLYLSLKNNKDKEDFLFPYPNHISNQSYLRVMRREFNKEFVGKAPHYFRHCRATHMVTRFGFDSHQLVKYFGWTDERPAKSYVKLKTEDLEAKMNGVV